MKKILGTTLVAMALASGAMANSGYIKGEVFNSTAQLDNKPSTTGFEVGFGGDGHFESTGNFLFGGAVNYGYQNYTFSSGTTNDMSTIGGELHLGWTFIDDLDVFGIVGYYGTTMDYTFSDGSTDTLTGGGIRYGAGVDYTIWKHLSVGVDYTTTKYNMTSANTNTNLGDVSFNNFGGNIKFRF